MNKDLDLDMEFFMRCSNISLRYALRTKKDLLDLLETIKKLNGITSKTNSVLIDACINTLNESSLFTDMETVVRQNNLVVK